MAHPKSVLIERCQALGLKKPVFSTSNTGPDHDPTFICDVIINDEVYGTGQATKKSDAEKYASEEALLSLGDSQPKKQSPSKKNSSAKSSKSNGRASRNNTRNTARQEAHAYRSSYEAGFEGPWPMFADVLASCISTANERADQRLEGDEAIAEVHRLSLQLYKSLLEDLGDIEEVYDDE